MEMEKHTVMFFEICRLCLEHKGYCDIFDENELCDNIFICTGVKIILSDSLPQKICSKCLDIVKNAAELRILAKKNDTRLKTLFDVEESETPEELEAIRMEVVSSQFKKIKTESPKKHPAIEKFLKVRKYLIDSAVSEDSICTSETQADSSDEKICTKRTLGDGSKEFKCTKCPKKFNVRKKYYEHSRFHNKSHLCPLDVCNKKFGTKGDLDRHIRTHTGEKPYNCNKCDKKFAQRGTLKVHKETVHDKA